MKILSLFDGMGCGRLALDRAGIEVEAYYASEIDKYAMAVTDYHYPDVVQLGDIREWRKWDIGEIDMVLAGSPCQGFSNAGKGLNFEDERSKLYFEFEKILEFYQPKYWLLENVKMKGEWADIIDNRLGVKRVEIDSALVSAQRRKRYYWANWKITQPEDKGIMTDSIIQYSNNKSNHINWQEWWNKNEIFQIKKGYSKIINGNKKSITLTARQISSWNGNLVSTKNGLRFITPIEAERLQTVPDNYTLVPWKNRMMSNTQRYKMLGNGWAIDVIAHILSCKNNPLLKQMEMF